jgi:mRNA interferase MazF
MKFAVGDIVWAALPERTPPGHEQKGKRPVLIVAIPEVIQLLPYSVIWIIPLSRTKLTGQLFPILAVGTGGLPAESTALIYQLTALDSSRIVGAIGTLTKTELEPIVKAIVTVLESQV